MIIRLLDGPLAGRVLGASDVLWTGGWLTVGEADWGLYVPVQQGSAAPQGYMYRYGS
ncbi:hypothetical protein [Streptomyces sp. NPDC058874]|uniref:hypothetical protein n=1 Tax=unclassified Streptomyces TaxID=2593676 RepID=UPI003684F518